MAKKRTRSNGEGTIYHNGKYWVGQVTIGQDPQSGKPKRKSIYGKTKREVSEKLVEMQNELNKGTFTDPTNATVKEWVNFWFENFKKNQLNGTTYENYQYKLNKHIIGPFGNIKFKNLTTYHIQEYINKLKNDGFSSSYIKSLKNTFNSMFKQAVKLDAIAKNPCDNLLLPRTDTKKQLQVLTKEEQKKFVDYCNNNNEFLFIFMLGTGVRISEALGLVWDCVDFKNDIINISNIIVEYKGTPTFQQYAKTEESARDIPMSEKIKEILLNLKSNQGKSNIFNLVFPSKANKFRYKTQIRKHLKIICEKINIKEITPHALRHTFATRMLESGVNIKVLSDILGHKNINITLDIYSHVLPDTKKEVMQNIDIFL